MSFLTGPKRTKTRYLIEVPHDADECGWMMDEIIGRGPQYGSMFWWGCHVGEHRAWAMLDGPGGRLFSKRRFRRYSGHAPSCTASRASTGRSCAIGPTPVTRRDADARRPPPVCPFSAVCYTPPPWSARPVVRAREPRWAALTLAAHPWYPYVLLF